MNSTLCALHMRHLIHRWRQRNLPARGDMDWDTKMLFVRHSREVGISPLEAAMYVGALAPRAQKRKRESSLPIVQAESWVR